MWHIFRGEHLGTRTHNQIAEALLKLDLGQTGAVGAALAPTGAAAECGLVGISKIDRSSLRAEKRDDLAQGQVQYLIQIEGLGRDYGHRVKCVQLAIAFSDFIFRSLLLSDIEQEALIALNFAGVVAGGETALEYGHQCAIFSAEIHLKVSDVVVGFDLAMKGI